MLVNGKSIALKEPVSLDVFLKEQGYDPRFVAVEKSGQIVPKAEFPQTILNDQDQLEIVGFVGGG